MNLQTRGTMKTVIQVLVGLVFCIGIGAVLIYSSLPIFWEHEERLQFMCTRLLGAQVF